MGGSAEFASGSGAALNVVVDTNVILAQIFPLPYSAAAERLFLQSLEEGRRLFAPVLWQFEAVSAIRKHLTKNESDLAEGQQILGRLLTLPVETILPTESLHLRALQWAERTGTFVAYDAVFLAVAEELGAEFWTADRPLVRVARTLKLPWVHELQESL